MTENWFQLLDRYQFEGHLGLTPAFLLGALRNPIGAVLDAEQSFADFRTLLESMRDEQPMQNKVVKIFECNNLGQPIAALSTHGYGAVPIVGRDRASAQLFAWSQYTPNEQDHFLSLVETLWAHFDRPICEGRFSYRRATGAFEQFDEDDLAFIERALKEEGDC